MQDCGISIANALETLQSCIPFCCGLLCVRYGYFISSEGYVGLAYNIRGCFNSLVFGRSGFDFNSAIFNLVWLIGIIISSCDNSLWWIPQGLTEDKLTLIQIMAWCRQATSHYLSQCWSRFMSPYGVTRQQCVNWHCTNGKNYLLPMKSSRGRWVKSICT